MLKRSLLLFFILASFFTSVLADNQIIDGTFNKTKYLLYTPTTSTDTLLVFLHGSGECGNNIWDIVEPKTSFPRALLENVISPEVAVLMPQAHNSKYFFVVNNILEVIKEIKNSLNCNKVIISGHSLGANAAYKLLVNAPEEFAGGILVSGRAQSNPKALLEHNIPVLIVHGTKDNTKVGIQSLTGFRTIFQDINLNNPMRTLKELESPYVEGNLTILWENWTHAQSPLVFREEYIWEWIRLLP